MTALDLTRHSAETLAGPLPPLLVAANRVAMSVVQGVHGRRRVGTGEAFWQYRRYQPGDPTGRIDWRQSAKSNAVFIRENEWEAAQSVWLWRDASDSMAFSSASSGASFGATSGASGDGQGLPTKRERADLLLLALAVLLLRGGERVGLLGHPARPGNTRSSLLRLTANLADTPSDSLPPPADLPRYGRVVLIGDFLSPLEEIQARLAEFAHRGVRGHVVRLLDPAELSLPYTGRVRFQGLENEGEMLARKVEGLRTAYQERMTAHRDGLRALTRALGWGCLEHRTDQPPAAALMALYLALSDPAAAGSFGGGV